MIKKLTLLLLNISLFGSNLQATEYLRLSTVALLQKTMQACDSLSTQDQDQLGDSPCKEIQSTFKCALPETKYVIQVSAINKADEVIGYSQINIKTCVIEAFFVVNSVRGTAAASDLMKRTLHKLNYCDEISLLVYEDNFRAIQFYKKHGFTVSEQSAIIVKMKKTNICKIF